MTRMDAKNRPVEGERISEYFNSERGDRYVRRYELLAILTQQHKAMRQNTWYSKFWRWLKQPRGSKGVHAVEPPRAQVEREERAAEAAANSDYRR